MKESEVQLLNRVRLFSSLAVLLVIVLSMIFVDLLGENSMSWQVALAVVALAIGIPHGALDHLVTMPKAQPLKMSAFVIVYVGVAALAVIVILSFDTIGFIAVLFMSVVHFGIGDAAFLNEIDRREDSKKRLSRLLFIPAAGFTPVFIPLVNSASTQALGSVNPDLINWHRGLNQEILFMVCALAAISIIALVLGARLREAIDLSLLLLLALLTPPLIAFATYFGCWHAMRHTARLTLTLPKCQERFARHEIGRAFLKAVIPGLPALLGTFAIAGVLALGGQSFTDEFFWMALVVVWALTVPHMVITAKLDRAALT